MSVNKIPKYIKMKNVRFSLLSLNGYDRQGDVINLTYDSFGIPINCDSEEEAIRLIHELDRELSRLGVKFIEIE